MADKTEKKSKGFFAGVKRFFGRIGKFFRDTVSEMKKVVWPSKKQIINNTVVVAVVVVVAAVLIMVLDAVFGWIPPELVLLAAVVWQGCRSWRALERRRRESIKKEVEVI